MKNQIAFFRQFRQRQISNGDHVAHDNPSDWSAAVVACPIPRPRSFQSTAIEVNWTRSASIILTKARMTERVEVQQAIPSIGSTSDLLEQLLNKTETFKQE